MQSDQQEDFITFVMLNNPYNTENSSCFSMIHNDNSKEDIFIARGIYGQTYNKDQNTLISPEEITTEKVRSELLDFIKAVLAKV